MKVKYEVPIIAVEVSKNRKVGSASATYAGQQTCPSACPLYRNGCYAETGPMGIHTSRLNKAPVTDVQQIAEAEASAIDGLTGLLDLRVHVVGDCTTAEGAGVVGAAMMRHQAKHGMRAWTYTHAWRDVHHDDWNGATVLASTETVGQVREARRRGYASALLVEEFSRLPRGQGYVACPNQSDGVQCVDCGLCLNPRLGDYGITIVFESHGIQKEKVNETLRQGVA